jgi:hypothetical protein
VSVTESCTEQFCLENYDISCCTEWVLDGGTYFSGALDVLGVRGDEAGLVLVVGRHFV